MKKCSKCNRDRRNKEFYKNSRYDDGLEYTCKYCMIKENKEYSRTINGVISMMYRGQKYGAKKREHLPPSYSKSEFKKWVLEQENFKILYENWVESDYSKNLKPSVDRKDDYISYTLNNIQLTTFIKNYKRSHKDRKNGTNNKSSVKTAVYNSITQKYIKTFHSMSKASLNTGVNLASISKIISNSRVWAKGKKGVFKNRRITFKEIERNY